MKKRFENFRRVWNRDTFVGERYENNIRNIGVVNGILILLGVLLVVVNLIKGDYFTAMSPLAFSLLSIATMILLLVFKSRRAACIMSLVNIVVILTYDILIISNGFAFLWTLLVPLSICYLFGLKEGFVLTAYFQLVFLAVFYTPLRQFVEGRYPAIVMERFPLLYLFNAIITFYVMYQYYASVISEIDHADHLTAEVQRQTMTANARAEKLERLSKEVVEALAKTIDAKDKYTNGHSFRVALYSVAIADRLGWSEEEKEALNQEALLHDIGKIGVHDSVLNKPGRLTEEEYAEIKQHTVIGKNILDGMEDMSDTALVVMYHHERYDGKGYPTGLSGEDIPSHARIVAIADAYDAMHADRIYRKALSREKIRQEFIDLRGLQFDPVYTDAFIQLLDDGTLDQLDA